MFPSGSSKVEGARAAVVEGQLDRDPARGDPAVERPRVGEGRHLEGEVPVHRGGEDRQLVVLRLRPAAEEGGRAELAALVAAAGDRHPQRVAVERGEGRRIVCHHPDVMEPRGRRHPPLLPSRRPGQAIVRRPPSHQPVFGGMLGTPWLKVASFHSSWSHCP